MKTIARRHPGAPGFEPAPLAPEPGRPHCTPFSGIPFHVFKAGMPEPVAQGTPREIAIDPLVGQKPRQPARSRRRGEPSPPRPFPHRPSRTRSPASSSSLHALLPREATVSARTRVSRARDQGSACPPLRAPPRAPDVHAPAAPASPESPAQAQSLLTPRPQEEEELASCDSEVLLPDAERGDLRALGAEVAACTVLSMQRLLLPPLKALMGSPCLRLLGPRAAPGTQVPHRRGSGHGEKDRREPSARPVAPESSGRASSFPEPCVLNWTCRSLAVCY